MTNFKYKFKFLKEKSCNGKMVEVRDGLQKYFLDHKELNFMEYQNQSIEINFLNLTNLECATCYEIKIFACTKLNIFFCEPSNILYVKTLIPNDQKTSVNNINSIVFTMLLLLLFFGLITYCIYVQRLQKMDEFRKDIEMNPITHVKAFLEKPKTRRYAAVVLSEVIGKGHFGKVYVGYLNENSSQKYAIKVCNYDLLEEAKLMKKLKTHHIVKFIKF